MLSPMIRHAIDAALLRRDPYLRMVIARDGVADGAVVVAVVHAVIVAPRLLADGVGFLMAVRGILGGLVTWIILSGLVYLIGRHGLEGHGSFPGTMAAVSIGFPVLLASLLLAPFVAAPTAYLIMSAWLVATMWVAARVALDLEPTRAAIAAVGGWVGFVIIATIFRF
jgi:hypothetical protein